MKLSDGHASPRQQQAATANGNSRPSAILPIHSGGMAGTVARPCSGIPEFRNRLVRHDTADT